MHTYATKIRQLTPSNITALSKAADAGLVILEHGATYAILPGTPAEALAAIQADMDQLKATSQQVRQTRYQSLIAVRNKLQGYVKDGVTAYVETYPVGGEPAAEVTELEHTAISDPAELSESEYLAEIDRLRRELPGIYGADAFLLGYTASGLTGQMRAQAITAAREQYADSLEQEQERRQDKVARVVQVRTAAEAGQAVAAIIEDTAADVIKVEAEDAADQAAYDSAEQVECDAPEPAATVTSHTATQAEGPLSAAPAHEYQVGEIVMAPSGQEGLHWYAVELVGITEQEDGSQEVTLARSTFHVGGGKRRLPIERIKPRTPIQLEASAEADREAGRASLAEHAVENGDAEAWTQEPGDQLPLHLELNLVVDLKAWALTYGLKTSPEVIADDVIAYLRASICELAAVEEGCYLRESVTLTRLP